MGHVAIILLKRLQGPCALCTLDDSISGSLHPTASVPSNNRPFGDPKAGGEASTGSVGAVFCVRPPFGNRPGAPCRGVHVAALGCLVLLTKPMPSRGRSESFGPIKSKLETKENRSPMLHPVCLLLLVDWWETTHTPYE